MSSSDSSANEAKKFPANNQFVKGATKVGKKKKKKNTKENTKKGGQWKRKNPRKKKNTLDSMTKF